MNSAALWRLIWKEYRIQRGFWIAMAILTVLLQLIVASFVTQPSERINALFHLALAIPAFYALGCGATLFATERETGTYEFQRALPVSAMRLFCGKLACAMAGTLAMIGLLWLLAVILAGGRLPEPGSQGVAWGVWGLAGLELMAWGVFFSLLSASPLKAALLGVTAASLSAFLAVSIVSPRSGVEGYLDVLLVRSMIVTIVGAVDVWLGYRWFREKPLWGHLVLRFRPREAAMDDTAGASGVVWSPRRVVLGRLVWQDFRQSARMLAIFAAMMAPLLLVGLWLWGVRMTVGERVRPSSGESQGGLWAMSVMMAFVTGPLLASCTFLADQQGRSFRFLTERAIRPRLIWLSRQLVWMPAVLLWVLTIGLAVFLIDPGVPVEFPVLLGVAILAYASGQMFSLFLHSGILAAFFTLVSTAVLCWWAMLMSFWGLSWLWSVVPIPVVLLLASWLRAPGWLLERNSLRAWLRPGGLLLVSAAALLMAVPMVRVYEIPDVDPGFSLEHYARAVTPEAEKTIALYRQATERYVSRYEVKPSEKAETQQEKPAEETTRLTAAEIAWVEANREAIALTVAASNRKECDFFDPDCKHSMEQLQLDCGELADLLVVSGRRLKLDGKLGPALDRYLAALRVSVHLRQRSESIGIMVANRVESSVGERLSQWAAHPNQTPQRVRRALEQMDETMRTVPPLSDAIIFDHLRSRAQLAADPDVLAALGADEDAIFAMTLWARWLPWEQARALRLLNRITQTKLARMRSAESILARGDRLAPPYEAARDYSEEPFALRNVIRLPVVFEDFYPTFLIRDLVWTETQRRAVRLIMAAEAWRHEHGELPGSLQDLVGPYLDRLPTDPSSGQPLRYFREGLPVPVSWQERYEGEPQVVAAGTPFIWGAGCRVGLDDGEDRGFSGHRIYDANGAVRQPSTELELCQAGWLFPLP